MKYLALISLFIFGCLSESTKVPYLTGAHHGTSWEKPSQPSTLPTFALKNQLGHNIKTVKGHITVSSFFFTHCPHMCPRTVQNLKSLAKQFQDQALFKLAAFSITPQSDSVPTLATFAKKQELSSKKWNLLTGPSADISNLADTYFYTAVTIGDSLNEPMHSQRVYLTDADGYLRGNYNSSLKLDMENLAQDINHLIAEMQNN